MSPPTFWTRTVYTMDHEFDRFLLEGAFGWQPVPNGTWWRVGAGLDTTKLTIMQEEKTTTGAGSVSWDKYWYEYDRPDPLYVFAEAASQWEGGFGWFRIGLMGDNFGSFSAGMGWTLK
jgi:hypothetical protein